MKSIAVFIFKKIRILIFVFFTKNLIFGWTPIKEGNKIIGMHRSSLWESPATYRLKGYGNDLDRWNSEKTSEHAIENRFGGSEYVEFDDNADDQFYLNKLKNLIPNSIDNFKPDFIFYLSGVDVLNNDKLGRLGLSIDGCRERDKFILELCNKNSIPVQVSMGGGYSELLKNIIEAHSNTFRLAQEIYF